jgi:hypothetical protein
MLVYGTDNNDNLVGTSGDDDIHGWGGADVLMGLAGNDILTGGLGSDTMTGGTGADTFVFGFQVGMVGGGDSSFSGWLAGMGYAGLLADGISQSNFSTAYTAWMNYLVDTFHLGSDVNGDGKISVEINQGSQGATPWIEGVSQADLTAMFGARTEIDVQTGRTMHERWYSDTFHMDAHECLTMTSGTDVVMDFNRAEGDNVQFNDVTAAQYASLFTVTEVDANHDNVMDTVITSACDPGFSITLLGVTGFGSATGDMQFDPTDIQFDPTTA